MKKIFIFLLALLSLCGSIGAQIDDGEGTVNLDSIFPLDSSYYYPFDNACHPPRVEALAVIQYQGYAKAFFEFKNGGYGSMVRYYMNDAPSLVMQTAVVNNGRVVLNNLIPNKVYTVMGKDDCGNLVKAAVIDTKTDLQEGVTVSGRFYNAIVNYLRFNEGTMPFPDFLNGLTDVSSYEKTAFIQQFFYGGQPFISDEGDGVPPVPPPPPGTDCFCSSIRTSEMAAPAIMDPSTGTIARSVMPGSDVEVSFGTDAAESWYTFHNIGAAKYHQLYTQGWRSNKGVDYDRLMTWTGDSLISYQQSWLRITFLCLDGEQIPKECECEKPVKFWYRYDTRVQAVADIMDGTSGSKNSLALAEDLAIVTSWNELDASTFKVLDNTLARAESHCQRTPNPDFWTNLADVFSNGASLTTSVLGSLQGLDSLLSPSEIKEINGQIDTFFTSIATSINTPYYNPTDCDNHDERFASMQNFKTVPLRPNKPFVMTINSFDNLYAGGRRAWRSNARVLSDFYLTAYIHQNAYDGTPRHCCTPKVGVWILGSCDGPHSTEQLKIQVAEKLYHEGMTNLPSSNVGNGYTVPFEFGYLWQPSFHNECNRVEINPRDDGSQSDTELETPEMKPFESLSIWDVSGKLISEFVATDIQPGVNIKQLVEQRLGHLTPGVYMVRLVGNGESKTQKIFIE